MFDRRLGGSWAFLLDKYDGSWGWRSKLATHDVFENCPDCRVVFFCSALALARRVHWSETAECATRATLPGWTGRISHVVVDHCCAIRRNFKYATSRNGRCLSVECTWEVAMQPWLPRLHVILATKRPITSRTVHWSHTEHARWPSPHYSSDRRLCLHADCCTPTLLSSRLRTHKLVVRFPAALLSVVVWSK